MGEANNNSSINLYIASFDFAPSNTDELAFKQGDKVLVTKKVEGGWWEGTCNGRCGWFPSNHVVPDDSNPDKTVTNRRMSKLRDKTASVLIYRGYVLQQILDTERTYVESLMTAKQRFIRPLMQVNFLEEHHKTLLITGFKKVCSFAQGLFQKLQAQMDEEGDQRFGRAFLNETPQLFITYTEYASAHHERLQILKELCKAEDSPMRKFLLDRSAPPSLTNYLDMPFERVEHYKHLLQELENHTEDQHPDMPALKAAVGVMEHVSDHPARVRGLRGSEYTLLRAPKSHWEGPELDTLGPLQLLSTFLIRGDSRIPNNSKCWLLLFTETLVVLQNRPQTNPEEPYRMLFNLPLSQITAIPMPSNPLEFILSGTPFGEPIALSSETAADRTQWVRALSLSQTQLARGYPSGASAFNVTRIRPIQPLASGVALPDTATPLPGPNTMKSSKKWFGRKSDENLTKGKDKKKVHHRTQSLGSADMGRRASDFGKNDNSGPTAFDVVEAYGKSNPTIPPLVVQMPSSPRGKKKDKASAKEVESLRQKVETLSADLATLRAQMLESSRVV
eukprot:m.93711 g.93711  ORF g.93711 m.93711 type:complete len:562 (+) comp21804_c0_seq2:41-1726(+)